METEKKRGARERLEVADGGKGEGRYERREGGRNEMGLRDAAEKGETEERKSGRGNQKRREGGRGKGSRREGERAGNGNSKQ